MKEYEGPILHIDLSVKDQLASSSGDGSIRIWKLDDNPKVVKVFKGASVQVNEFAATKIYSTPTFDPRGNFLAYPKDSSIVVVDTSSWETKFKLNNDEVTGVYTACSISFCGAFVAAGSLNGEISVWNFADKSKLKGPCTGDDSHSITSIAWNPKNNGEFSFCDYDGQLSTILVGSHSDSSRQVDSKGEVDEQVSDDVDDIYGGIDFHDNDDEENENCVSLEKLKNETMKGGVDSEDDDDAKTIKSVPSVAPSELHRATYVKQFQLQPSFQPGSTPVSLEHRFMVCCNDSHIFLRDDNLLPTFRFGITSVRFCAIRTRKTPLSPSSTTSPFTRVSTS